MRIFKIQDLDASSIRWGCIGWGSIVLNLSYIPKVSLDEWDSGDGWLLTGVKGTIPDANPSPLAGQEGMLAHSYSCQLMAGSSCTSSLSAAKAQHCAPAAPCQGCWPGLTGSCSQGTPEQGRGCTFAPPNAELSPQGCCGIRHWALSPDHCAWRLQAAVPMWHTPPKNRFLAVF